VLGANYQCFLGLCLNLANPFLFVLKTIDARRAGDIESSEKKNDKGLG
jgi:hypothetical protein